MIFNRLLIIISLQLISHTSLADDNTVTILQNTDNNNEIIQLQQSNKVYEKVIKNLIKRIEKLEQSPDSKITNIPENKEIIETQIDPVVKARLEKESEENSKLINAAFEQRLSKEGGMLLSKHQSIYEFGLSYAHSSYDKIVVDGFTVYPVLVVGDIVSEKVRRDIITNNHSFRLGLGSDMQMDLSIPFGYEKVDSFRGDGTYESKEISGLGDIFLGLSYQLVNSNSDWPNTVVALNWKTATGQDPYRLISADELALGTGFNTYGVSMTSMANSDPIVLFGGLSFYYTEGRDKQIGHVNPGFSSGLNLGMALALNFDTSLSFNFQFRYTDQTKINGQKINGSDLTTSIFAIGLSTTKGKFNAVDIDLGIGLTADSPDFQLTVSFPFNFSFL